jgi:hypothetical protein
MNKYILGEKIIETTEERYQTTFKALGYVPYAEKEKKVETKVVEKNEEVKTSKKIEEK